MRSKIFQKHANQQTIALVETTPTNKTKSRTSNKTELTFEEASTGNGTQKEKHSGAKNNITQNKSLLLET